MKLSIQIANPAGNVTIFVLNPVPSSQYAAIAAQLLAREDCRAEQVAFCTAPQQGADGRIEMMGGEFCGNATRSYGYLLGLSQARKPDTVRVEISGADHPLAVSLDYSQQSCETEMPLPIGQKQVLYDGNRYDAVCFEGIIHILVPGAVRSEDFVAGLFAAAKKALPCSAYGILFLSEDTMVPVVLVCETSSVIWESSCGSGSMAVACHRALCQGSDYHCSLRQPGGTITASAKISEGAIVGCRMGGPVSVSEELVWEL